MLKVRERYLNDDELTMVPADDVVANVIAWTAKEALFKASLMEGVDFRSRIILKSLPTLGSPQTAEAYVVDNDGNNIDFLLYSYESEGNVVTIAITTKTATFKKRK